MGTCNVICLDEGGSVWRHVSDLSGLEINAGMPESYCVVDRTRAFGGKRTRGEYLACGKIMRSIMFDCKNIYA